MPTALNDDELKHVLDVEWCMAKEYARLWVALDIALVCKRFGRLVCNLFADDPVWAERARAVALRCVRLCQCRLYPAIVLVQKRARAYLCEEQTAKQFASALVPNTGPRAVYTFERSRQTVAQFATQVYVSESRFLRDGGPYDAYCWWEGGKKETLDESPWFELRSSGAIETFSWCLEYEIVKMLRVALNYATERASTLRTPLTVTLHDVFRAGWHVIQKFEVNDYDHDSNSNIPTAFRDEFEWNIPTAFRDKFKCKCAPVDAQLRVVAALAHSAGITKFEADCTRPLWCLLLNRASELIDKACLIAVSPIDTSNEEPQYDDGTLESDSESECSSDDSSSEEEEREGSEDDSEAEECEAGKRKWYPEPCPDTGGVHYVMTPTAECFRWAAERLG